MVIKIPEEKQKLKTNKFDRIKRDFCVEGRRLLENYFSFHPTPFLFF
jgi:hypothetical protein